MVQAIVTLGDYEDRMLSVVKGKYGFRNKSDAINFVIREFGKDAIEPAIRPEYEKELMRISKGPHIKYRSMDEMRTDVEDARAQRKAQAGSRTPR